jgi:hypothetical protein
MFFVQRVSRVLLLVQRLQLPRLFFLQRLLVFLLSRVQRLLGLPRLLQRRGRRHGRLPRLLWLLGMLLLVLQRLLGRGVQWVQLQ